MTTYKNPWYKPLQPMYGPEYYTTNAKPTEYMGYLIYHREGMVWDVVKDGVCVTQLAGMRWAKAAIEELVNG